MNNEERNAFVERRYDELRMEGKHGHYECLFRVVHEIVDAELARVREELEIEKAKFPAIGSPLQKLGALLADLLDEDRFAQAEQFMLAEYAEKERVARRAAEIADRIEAFQSAPVWRDFEQQKLEFSHG